MGVMAIDEVQKAIFNLATRRSTLEKELNQINRDIEKKRSDLGSILLVGDAAKADRLAGELAKLEGRQSTLRAALATYQENHQALTSDLANSQLEADRGELEAIKARVNSGVVDLLKGVYAIFDQAETLVKDYRRGRELYSRHSGDLAMFEMYQAGKVIDAVFISLRQIKTLAERLKFEM